MVPDRIYRTEGVKVEDAMDWLRRFTEKWGWYTPGSAKSANEYLAAKEQEEANERRIAATPKGLRL
jgi:hypothetical protein